MADSPASSDLSDPPSVDSDAEDQLSTAVPSSRPSVDITHADHDHVLPPSKRRKTGPSTLATFDRAPSSQPADDDDTVSLSSDGYSTAPGSPTHDEYTLRDEAQTQCLWKDCSYGEAVNNDELVRHVQGTHCATGGPKKSKYVCEWGECQRKTSNHPSGYALKAHMRSHTKEKPYYCALPGMLLSLSPPIQPSQLAWLMIWHVECDKAFTRSDALAKHMRTVHEPEAPRATANDPTPPGKKSIKLKLTNGSTTTKQPPPTPTPIDPATLAPTHDEDGNPVDPSPPNDNIAYNPAHHPLTGQPGFMITYPPDIHFTAWESSITADQLMRLMRRQLRWAEQEGEALRQECAELESVRRGEWGAKEGLLDGVMEEDFARAGRDGLLGDVDARVRKVMEGDMQAAKDLSWTGGEPVWRHQNHNGNNGIHTTHAPADEKMAVETPPAPKEEPERSPSPPPTAKSGGFDGDADPYDNYLEARMAEYEERERLRSLHNTPQKVRQTAAEADAVGALIGMSGQT